MKLIYYILILCLVITSCINGDNAPSSEGNSVKVNKTTYTIYYNEDSAFQSHYKNWKSNIIIDEYSGGKKEPRENKIDSCHDGIKIVCTANSITDYITIHINRTLVKGCMTEILSPWFYDPIIILKRGENNDIVINGDVIVGYNNNLCQEIKIINQ
jgi:hypothetical protein